MLSYGGLTLSIHYYICHDPYYKSSSSVIMSLGIIVQHGKVATLDGIDDYNICYEIIGV